MSDRTFVDLYELLELSPTASSEAIESMYRYHARRYHPDAGATGNQEKFKQLVQAYTTLKDPAKRAAYDLKYERHRREQKAIVAAADSTTDDYAVRQRLLAIFYAARRQNMKEPGLGITTVEQMMKIPSELLQFHMWYFREKGWIQREVSGPWSITYAGVDEIESREAQRLQQSQRAAQTVVPQKLTSDALRKPVLM